MKNISTETTEKLKHRYLSLGEELLRSNGNGSSPRIRAERIQILHQLKKRGTDHLSKNGYRLSVSPEVADKLEKKGIVFGRKKSA